MSCFRHSIVCLIVVVGVTKIDIILCGVVYFKAALKKIITKFDKQTLGQPKIMIVILTRFNKNLNIALLWPKVPLYM